MSKSETISAESSKDILDEEQLEQVSGGGLGIDLDEETKKKLSSTQIEGENNCPSFLFPDYWS